MAIEVKREKARQTHKMEMMKLQLKFARACQVTPGVVVSTPTQHSQSSIHLPSLYLLFSPDFSFGDSRQFDGMVSGSSGSSGVE